MTILIVLVAFAVFPKGSLQSELPQNEIEVAGGELEQCIRDIWFYIKTSNVNVICKDKNDFTHNIDKYSDAVEKKFNATIERNEMAIDYLIFTFDHRYTKDYLLSHDEGKDCIKNLQGEPSSSAREGTSTKSGNKGYLEFIFSGNKKSYSQETCDKIRWNLEQLKPHEPNVCNSHTLEYLIDSYKHQLKYCDPIAPTTQDPVIDVNKKWWQDPTTFWLLVIASVTFITLVAVLILACVLQRCCLYPNEKKSNEPTKENPA